MSKNLNKEPSSAPTNPTPVQIGDFDPELVAINTIVTTLGALNDEQRQSALGYVLRRFNASGLQGSLAPVIGPGASILMSTLADQVPQTQGASPAIHDIRTLKETKAPKSANEMAALVAYYVSELAPGTDRKGAITKSDIERYFKMAGFHLPAEATFTLVNAKNAGYLESAGGGQYKLNPVGYNLVAHRMGNRDTKENGRGRGPRKAAKKRPSKKAKKAARAKK